MRRPRLRRRAVLSAVIITAGLAATAAFAAGNAGTLDPSFAGTGYTTADFGPFYSFANGVTNYDGGKSVVVGGWFDAATVQGDFAIARFNKDGSPDSSFGTGGKVTVDFFGSDDLADAVTTQGDKIVVAGYASPDGGVTYEFALVRLNKNGSLDSSFGAGGKVVQSFSSEDIADAVAVKGDKIVAAGTTMAGGGGRNFALARFNKDGSLDTSFGTGGLARTDFNGLDDVVHGLAFMGDDLVAAGPVGSITTGRDFGLARFNKNGSLDTGFGAGGKVETDFFGGNDAANALDVKGERIVAVGVARNGVTLDDFAAALYDKRGNLDPHFGTGGKATLDVGDIDTAFGGGFGPGESVVAAGDTYGAGPDQFAVGRWTKDGQPDPKFGTGGSTTTLIGTSSAAFAMTLGPEDKIVAAGYSDDTFAVARYLNK